MKIARYLVLVGLSFIVACGNPPTTVTLTASDLNPVFNSSVTFTATAAPASQIAKLELLEGTTVLKTVANTATLEQSVLMGVAGKKSFTARVTDTAGLVASSAVLEVNTNDTNAALNAVPNQVLIGDSSTLVPELFSGNSGIAQVEFFEGIASLGKVTSAPFELKVNSFTTVGTREFKVVVKATNGLTSEAKVKINVASFKIIPGLTDLEFSRVLLSPDITVFSAFIKRVNETNIFVSGKVNWTILKQDGTPAPTDGSFGQLKVFEDQVNGLQGFRITYDPPVIAAFQDSLLVKIKAVGEDDNSIAFFDFTVKKKGTLSGIALVTTAIPTLKVGESIEVRVVPVGVIGNVYGLAINVTSLEVGDSVLGFLECLEIQCQKRILSSGLTSLDNVRKFKLTALTVGKIRVNARSIDRADLPAANLEITVVP
jgi:hypothetical protein